MDKNTIEQSALLLDSILANVSMPRKQHTDALNALKTLRDSAIASLAPDKDVDLFKKVRPKKAQEVGKD